MLAFLDEVKRRIPQVEVVFDCPSSKGVAYANRYVRKTGNLNALIHFYVDGVDDFVSKAKARLKHDETFFVETRRILRDGLNLYTRLAMKVVDHGGYG